MLRRYSKAFRGVMNLRLVARNPGSYRLKYLTCVRRDPPVENQTEVEFYRFVHRSVLSRNPRPGLTRKVDREFMALPRV
jgi:hypothetical protein